MKNIQQVLISTLIIFILFLNQAFSQQFYRITGEFSIKAKAADGTSQLTMGTFYYDRNMKKIIYQNYFPEKETWVMSDADTTVYKIVNGKVISKKHSPPLSMFSIYHLALSSKLSNFGLENTPFKIENVEKQGNMVITTWTPPTPLKKYMGNILISTIEKKINGIIFYDEKQQIMKKQFFDKYINISGLEFPTEITEIATIKNKDNYQVTTYKNIKINDTNEDNMYNYIAPK